jgi:hypothetical protein
MRTPHRLLFVSFVVALPAASGYAQDSAIPTPEESRAALMEPISTQPSTGDSAQIGGVNTGQPQAGQADQQPSAPPASRASAPAGQGTNPSSGPPPSGPISAFGQTIPAKFSKRNDILDRTPIMAWPLKLSDEELRQIYQAVMADGADPAAGAEALMPASQLSTAQALEGMHPLPESLRDIAPVQRLKYVKGKDKVLLVDPVTRVVVDQIKSQG